MYHINTILIMDIFSLLILLVMRSQHTSNVQRDMRKCDLNISGNMLARQCWKIRAHNHEVRVDRWTNSWPPSHLQLQKSSC